MENQRRQRLGNVNTNNRGLFDSFGFPDIHNGGGGGGSNNNTG